jgi:hypothetical protein
VNANQLNYYQEYSSKYFQRSQEKFESEYKKFEQRVSDAKHYYSDLFLSDGYMTPLRNQSSHHYHSGYETSFDLPATKLAQAFSLPLLVSIMCGYFLVNSSSGKKPEAADKEDEAKFTPNKL